jgi:ribonuclease BN (tRNA processing enzyme)
MSSLDLTFVGTGNAFAPGGLCWNGFVAGGRYLFEAPPSALMALHRAAIDPNALDAVIVSHHHGDHFLGLSSLILHWKYNGRERPVVIAGPPGTAKLAKTIGNAVYPGLFEGHFDIQWLELSPGKTMHIGDLEVEPVLVEHDDRLSLSLGYQCVLNGRRFAYTGDSALCDGVLDMARASEVLVSECASVDGHIPIHMNLVDDIPKVRAAMPASATLVLTHITPDVHNSGLPNTFVAEDLKTFRF